VEQIGGIASDVATKILDVSTLVEQASTPQDWIKALQYAGAYIREAEAVRNPGFEAIQLLHLRQYVQDAQKEWEKKKEAMNNPESIGDRVLTLVTDMFTEKTKAQQIADQKRNGDELFSQVYQVLGEGIGYDPNMPKDLHMFSQDAYKETAELDIEKRRKNINGLLGQIPQLNEWRETQMRLNQMFGR
jgi:phage major head subunit gpT-like protein